MDMSSQEYEETYSRNRRFVGKNLISYSKYAIGLTGLPEQSVNFMGAALDMVINGASLDLNESKTLALEFKGVDKSERALFFRIKIGW